MSQSYQDIIHLSRPVSKHPKMLLDNRAKIFAPFSALRGFEIEILTKEKDRELLLKSSPTDQLENEIDWNLSQLQVGDTVCITWFRRLKTLGEQELGEYVTETATFYGLDLNARMIHLSSRNVPIEDIQMIEGVNEHEYISRQA